MNKMIAIAACPFCGSGEQETQFCFNNLSENFVVVSCQNCNAHGPKAGDVDGAIRCWNERVADLSVAVPATEHQALERKLKLLKHEVIAHVRQRVATAEASEYQIDVSRVLVGCVNPLLSAIDQVENGEIPLTLCATCGKKILVDEPMQHDGDVDFCATCADPDGLAIYSGYTEDDARKDLIKIRAWRKEMMGGDYD